MPRYSFFGGVLAFDVRSTTPGARMRRLRLMEHEEKPALEDKLEKILYRNMCHILAVTERILIDADRLPDAKTPGAAAFAEALNTLRDFWQAAQNNVSPAALYEVFAEDLHAAIYDAWVEAVERADVPFPQVPVAQRPPDLLTDAERADPK